MQHFLGTKVIHAAHEVLAVPLQRVVNTSIRDRKYPDVFRDEVAMPVLERGSKQDKICYIVVQNSEAAARILEFQVNGQVVRFLR